MIISAADKTEDYATGNIWTKWRGFRWKVGRDSRKRYQAGGALTCPSFSPAVTLLDFRRSSKNLWEDIREEIRESNCDESYPLSRYGVWEGNFCCSIGKRKSQASYEETVNINHDRSYEYEKMLTQKTEQYVVRTIDINRAQELESTIKTELVNVHEFEKSLNTDCDWLVQNYDLRRQGRRNEIDYLTKVKSVLKDSDACCLSVRTPRVHSAFLAAWRESTLHIGNQQSDLHFEIVEGVSNNWCCKYRAVGSDVKFIT